MFTRTDEQLVQDVEQQLQIVQIVQDERMLEEVNQQTKFVALIVEKGWNRSGFENFSQGMDAFETADLKRGSSNERV